MREEIFGCLNDTFSIVKLLVGNEAQPLVFGPTYVVLHFIQRLDPLHVGASHGSETCG